MKSVSSRALGPLTLKRDMANDFPDLPFTYGMPSQHQQSVSAEG